MAKKLEVVPLKTKDIKIVQDTQILQQILKTLPGDMKNQINVIMVNEIKNEDSNFEFMKLLQSLPEPRLENLKRYAIKASLGFFRKKRDVAKFLGINSHLLMPSYRNDYIKEMIPEKGEDE